MQIISVTQDKRQRFTTVLENQRVDIVIYYIKDYIAGNSGWFINMTLISSVNEVIVLGNRLNSFQFVARGVPTNFQGAIVPLPITVPFEDLTGETPWGVTHNLLYFSPDDLALLESAGSSEAENV
jgi:hypothetical protein